MAVYSIPGFSEPVNSLMHLGAAGVFAALGVRLLGQYRDDARRAALLGVFVFSTVLLLSMSGVYHMLDAAGAGASVMIRLDKAAIFVLIAGTFTPVHGMLFRGVLRWAGLGVMWLAAATGVTLVSVYFDQLPRAVTSMVYLSLGWLAALCVIEAWRRWGFRFIAAAIAGGVSYSLGAALLELNWPIVVPGVFGPHEFWHVAVIMGVTFHWWFISRLARVMPADTGKEDGSAVAGMPASG